MAPSPSPWIQDASNLNLLTIYEQPHPALGKTKLLYQLAEAEGKPYELEGPAPSC